MADYQEEVYRMRMERKQAEAADRYQQLVEQYNQAVEARDEESLQILSKGGDRSEYDYWDQQVEEAERGLAPYIRAQQPQAHPAATQWDARRKAYVERLQQKHGYQGAMQRFAALDGYITRPKIQNETNPSRTGMGIARNSPAYFKAADELLELHSDSFFGVKFDPNESTLTPNEACEISGTAPAEWNRQAQLAWQQGKIGRGT
jgi:hypothetical protein